MSDGLHVEVLFFASLKERTGAGRVRLELPANASVADLKVRLKQEYPRLTDTMASLVVSVNKE
ncbi:MAG TPA: MoaD/ThiS family protein, partial [Anaerolinea sp.]|nr:MoaD/ThiS family protein [Anaerolinea sp.]